MAARSVGRDRARLLAAGMATVDNIYWLGNHPVEDTENRVADYRAAVGAPAGRGAIAAARLGLDVALVATRGDDVFGQVLDGLLADEPLDRRLVVSAGPSQQSCVIVAQDTGSRTTIWTAQPAADERVDEILRQELATACVVLTDTTDLRILRTLHDAPKDSGVQVVVDTGDYPLEDPEVLRGVDFVIAPQTFAARMADGRDTREWARAMRASLDLTVLAVTEGDLGGWWVSATDHGRWEARPADVVDTCGAGDAFHGAFAWAIAHGLAFDRAFDVASWVASRHVSASGNDGLPRRRELLDAAVVDLGELRY